MQISDLIKDIQTIRIVGELDQETTAITADSRQVTTGSTFVAVRGTQHDGHQYIERAVDAGAKLIIAEKIPERHIAGVCYIQVEDSTEALGLVSSAFWGHPSKKMTVVGVTGTNGKTTIATLLYRLFLSLDYKASLLSTITNFIVEEPIEATHTTPDAIELQKLLNQMHQAGTTHVFMEISSHAAEQKRIAGVDFDGAIFTNLTRDHLDYHGSMLAYINAKKLFFDGLKPEAFALVNIDDKNAQVMLQNCRARQLTYALERPADYKGLLLEEYADSTLVNFDGRELTLRLVGRFNVYNALAVYAAAQQIGLKETETMTALSKLPAVDGRFQTFSSQHGYTVVVDYAHTPDAISNVLLTIKDLLKPTGRIIAVIGAGGDRDRGKRPLMAQQTARLAKQLIITSDNPRSERPEDIIAEMLAGLSEEECNRTLSIPDRKEAIRIACMLAKKNDFVLVAGKGHETYQEINGVRHHFDDREVVRSIIAEERH